PTEEHEYWRNEYKNREYVEEGAEYETYAPAYQYGWESYSLYGTAAPGAAAAGTAPGSTATDLDLDDTDQRADAGSTPDTASLGSAQERDRGMRRDFDDVETDLQRDWDERSRDVDLTWDKA